MRAYFIRLKKSTDSKLCSKSVLSSNSTVKWIELEHSFFQQVLYLIVWVLIFVAIGGVLTVFTNPFEYAEPRLMHANAENLVILGIWFAIGVWFGIIGQIYSYMGYLRYLLKECLSPTCQG